MRTKIEGIEHFSKLMNFLSPRQFSNSTEVDEQTFKNYMSNFNYRRDWWGDCVLYKYKKKILGFIDKDTKKYYIKEINHDNRYYNPSGPQ